MSLYHLPRKAHDSMPKKNAAGFDGKVYRKSTASTKSSDSWDTSVPSTNQKTYLGVF